jgi:hypothetical protein
MHPKESAMNVRTICTGHFSLPLAVEDAKPLFTPEGERRWAGSSWDPIYAIPEAVEDDSAPGTVFTTESDGGMATWIVLQRREDGMRYARVAHDRIAGTIDVTCLPGTLPSEAEVTVRYDVTSLSPSGTVFVKELEASFDAFLDSWRQEIIDNLEAGGAGSDDLTQRGWTG